MTFIAQLSAWSTTRSAWVVLFCTALAFEVTALIFQHGFGFEPCVMCIYQRTAMWGIVLAGALVLIYNNVITRILGYSTWLVCAIWGAQLSWEHIDILTASNPFFASCEIVPNFPAFMPLHEWLPAVFAAPGYCDDDSWQFLNLGMPQWMFGIFIAYALTAMVCLVARLWDAKKP